MQSPWEGRLVRLRAREPEDEPLMFQWFNDPETTEFLVHRYPLSHQQEKDFISSNARVGYHGASFAVESLADGKLIGSVGLHHVSPENRNAELGIAIGEKAYRDGGFGTDTMLVLCRFGFEMMNLHRIELEVFAANERARHVYEKIGFREEARRRQAFYKWGRYHDLIVMGLLERELVDPRAATQAS